ncbi:MAG: FadR family transcriptional regulator [Rhodobacter sp.]|nr:FadR family transcriptional regulator [Rhodobacter sp.]
MQVRNSVMQTLARTLQDLIQRGEWKPEQKIPSQRTLSEQYGVSRTSLREALLTLETLGLIRTYPARGTFVTGPLSRARRDEIRWRYSDDYSLREVFDIRMLIEGRLAAGAAGTMTAADIAALHAATDAMEKAWTDGDLLANVEADLVFHRLIADSCQNRLLRQTYISLSDFLAETQRLPIPFTERDRMSGSIAEHRAIAAAIEARDAAGAEAAMIGHIRKTAACAGVLV